MIENKTERVAIFIDGSNFYHSVKDTFGLHDNQIDFSKLIEILKNKRMLIGVYFRFNAHAFKHVMDIGLKRKETHHPLGW